MKTNVKTVSDLRTHEGAPAKRINAEQELRRSVMACMLWEDSFYEDGHSIAERITGLVAEVAPMNCANIAIEARENMKLRHAPLWIVLSMAKLPSHKMYVAGTLSRIIQRVDEIAEFLSLYWLDGKKPVSAQIKKGLASAFLKFNEYQFAKYNRDGAIKLRDVMFLVHPKPVGAEQEVLFKKIANNELETPDTWEVALSTGKDKKETWERLITENKLGALAFIRNLRNMNDVKVNRELVISGLKSLDVDRVLPFRFVAAAKAAPNFEDSLDELLLKSLSQREKLKGKTVVVIDVSGSMYGSPVSKKSDIDRAIAACALGAIAREVCENASIYATAGNDITKIHQTALVPTRHGMALIDSIYGMCRPLGGGGIFLTPVCKWIAEREENVDRMIVITDEQDCASSGSDSPVHANPLGKHNYLINVSVEKNGIGYGQWTHLDGFSESLINYIIEYEKQE
jgi:60 kDa SS-A/Ro ribonucleoprotein